jgi:hypothetical protein
VRFGVGETGGGEAGGHLLGTDGSTFGAGLAGERSSRIRQRESRANDRSD